MLLTDPLYGNPESRTGAGSSYSYFFDCKEIKAVFSVWKESFSSGWGFAGNHLFSVRTFLDESSENGRF